MKKLNKQFFIFLSVTLLTILLTNPVAAQKDSVISKEMVKLRYFNDNNAVQYLILENLLKTGSETKPQMNKTFHLFLDSNTIENLIAKVFTNTNGKAKAFIPPSLKNLWESSPKHTFIAVAQVKGNDEGAVYATEITKAKITIDTLSDGGTRTVSVSVSTFNGTEWVPAPDVEMKVGVSRSSGGILSAGDKETYTTDSTGTVAIEFARDSLPGDEKGNMLLVAKVEDNDQYGNLLVAKVVPWGVVLKPDNGFFNQRTLWTTRFRTPFWLLFLAYSIVIGVWVTIFYLIGQILKIKKLGTSASS